MDPSHGLGPVQDLTPGVPRARAGGSPRGDQAPRHGLARIVRGRLAPVQELAVAEDAGCMFTDGEGGLLGTVSTGPTARALATIEELAGRGPCHHTLGLADDDPDEPAVGRGTGDGRATTQVYDLTARWPFDRLLGPAGPRRVLTRPVRHDGRTVGVCFVTSNALRPWTTEELQVHADVAEGVSQAVAEALREASPGDATPESTAGAHPQVPDELVGRILATHRTASERDRAVAIIRRHTGTTAAAARRRLRQMGEAADATAIEVARQLIAADDVPGVGDLVAAATDRGQREELARLALTDPLTGLPNRVLLLDRLEHAVWRSARGGGNPGVVYLDLDGFKAVNDQLGHDAGDRVLRTAASRIMSAVRPQDTVARLGGDEFAVVCEAIDRDDAVDVARRIARALDAPMEPTPDDQQDAATLSAHDDPSRPGHLERPSTIRASIGVALAHPGQPAADVLRDADTAMYRSKAEGAAITVFEPAMGQARTRRLRLSADLPAAIARFDRRDEPSRAAAASAAPSLDLAYLPIVDLATHRVLGLEAVLRWDHPEVGLVDRSEIDALAAPAGLATPLTEALLYRVGAAAAAWRRRGERRGERPRDLAVPLAPSDLSDPRYADLVLAALRSRGLPPAQLCLEVRDQDVRAGAALAVGTLRRLHAAGVVLVLDGIGSGSSSLPNLSDLPIRVLRLAPLLVAALNTRQAVAVTRAIIGLARDLDLRVVAAGVTTEDQHAQLAELGCGQGQGPYYGPGVDPDSVPARVPRPLPSIEDFRQP